LCDRPELDDHLGGMARASSHNHRPGQPCQGGFGRLESGDGGILGWV